MIFLVGQLGQPLELRHAGGPQVIGALDHLRDISGLDEGDSAGLEVLAISGGQCSVKSGTTRTRLRLERP